MYYQNPNAQYNGAYTMSQPQQQDIPWTNPLSDQERKLLKEKDPELVLVATDKELAQSKCTHRDPQRRCTTLRKLSNGTWKCEQCGAEFNIVDLPVEEIEKYALGVIDILQTTKLMYVNLPPQTVSSFFSMIPFLEKLPKLYETAQNVFRKANGNLGVDNYQDTSNPWGILNNVVSNPAGFGMPFGYGAYNQPMNMYQQPQQMAPGYMNQPQYQQAPVMQQQPVQGYYADPGFNPLQQAPQGAGTQFFNGQPGGYMQQPVQAQSAPIPAAQNQQGVPTQTTEPAAPAKPEGETVKTNKQFSL